jgi:hypothetical protein
MRTPDTTRKSYLLTHTHYLFVTGRSYLTFIRNEQSWRRNRGQNQIPMCHRVRTRGNIGSHFFKQITARRHSTSYKILRNEKEV